MRFFTNSEAAHWCRELVRLDERQLPVWPRAEQHHIRVGLPAGHAQLTWFCRHLEQSLRPRDSCLLWVTEWGVWNSSENWHLYYRLRHSYGDLRLMHEAPAHLFLDYEGVDLVTFLEVGILSGWDMHLIPTVGYARAFVSHDEFVEFAADDHNPGLLEEFAKPLAAEGTAGPPERSA
jgi:hypothetical protein